MTKNRRRTEKNRLTSKKKNRNEAQFSSTYKRRRIERVTVLKNKKPDYFKQTKWEKNLMTTRTP